MSTPRVLMTGLLASAFLTVFSLLTFTGKAEAAFSTTMTSPISSHAYLNETLVSQGSAVALLSYQTLLHEGQESLLLAKQGQQKKAKKKTTKKKAKKKNGNKGKHKGQTQGKRKGHNKEKKNKSGKKKATKKR